ncbi:Uncharacterized protein PCOAH_00004070 [Plasmodium coatneyi]|uniref:Uncharacterized protein n=1 Tax=Plasmodium coatneyi TaxID=208452 RepID=A0A1B1DTP6_9APIC|nr:Uncharacterized protein PCOAH_00004070 [Plasmodium coatneyi]ANQ06132.1 Uncharacterized protein PCOAH_00004070 [Plasmodium coatneyi]
MNNGTSFQSEALDGNDTRVITFVSNSTPLATDIDPFSSEGKTNQLSTTVTSTVVESLLNGVTEVVSDAMNTVISSISGNESLTLHPLSVANEQSVPVTHSGTNISTEGNYLPGGSSQELCLILNIIIFLLPFLSLLIVIPIAAWLYDKTPLGGCYNRVCDFLCVTPDEDEQDNEGENEIDGDIEKGACAGGARRKYSLQLELKKNKRRKKKFRRKQRSYTFPNPTLTKSDIQGVQFTHCGNESGDTLFNPPLYGTYFNELTGVEGEKDDNGNDNKGTRTKGRKDKEDNPFEGIGHVNFAFCSESPESGMQGYEENHF